MPTSVFELAAFWVMSHIFPGVLNTTFEACGCHFEASHSQGPANLQAAGGAERVGAVLGVFLVHAFPPADP